LRANEGWTLPSEPSSERRTGSRSTSRSGSVSNSPSCGPSDRHPDSERAILIAAEELLADLSGIVAVRKIDGAILQEAAAEERRYESGGILPVRNVGIDTALARRAVFAVLKDRSFRPPPAPTVYLVEEHGGGDVPGEQLLQAGDRTYRILGEEVLPGRGEYEEKTIELAGSFVMFPGRREGPNRPSYFLVPALGFAELEAAQAPLGIRGIFSISPSAGTDALLRERCGFPPDPELATLLVGFDYG
jgi:hypothetical protein